MKSFILKISLLVSSFVLVITLILSTVQTYAWMLGKWQGNRELSFTASQGTDPDFYAWVYDVQDENSGETLMKSGSWRNIAVNGTGIDHTFEIQKATDRGIANSEKFTFTSLHIGTVDNLISLSSDNYFYMRFDIDNTVRQGRKAKIGYTLSSAGLHFYDLNGVDQTNSLSAQEKEDFISIPIVEYAIGTVKYDLAANAAQQSSIDDLFTSENTNGYGLLTNGAALTDIFNTDRTDGYTLYLRIHPDLDTCFEVTDALGTYMPCQVLYDFDLDLEFYQIHV